MPVHDIGYRHWTGDTRDVRTRWWSITRWGVALSTRNWFIRRFFFLPFAPLIYYVPVFLAIGYSTQQGADGELARVWREIVRELLGSSVSRGMQADPLQARAAAWSTVFYMFFAYAQSIMVFVVMALVGPPLISRDIRSRSFLIYFSKPIVPGEYILGKAGILVCYVAYVVLLPALLLYAISIGFSPSVGSFLDTWRTIGSILIASAVLAVPVSLLLLALSSIVRNEIYATFAWIVICVFGEMSYRALSLTCRAERITEPAWLSLLSLRQTFAVIFAQIFGVSGNLEVLSSNGRTPRQLRWLTMDLKADHAWVYAAVFLGILSVGCYWFVRRRIRGVLGA